MYEILYVRQLRVNFNKELSASLLIYYFMQKRAILEDEEKNNLVLTRVSALTNVCHIFAKKCKKYKIDLTSLTLANCKNTGN